MLEAKEQKAKAVISTGGPQLTKLEVTRSERQSQIQSRTGKFQDKEDTNFISNKTFSNFQVISSVREETGGPKGGHATSLPYIHNNQANQYMKRMPRQRNSE